MSLKRKIIDNLPDIPNGIEVFLFGSILTSVNCNDIDIALIYDKEVVGLERAINIRRMLQNYIVKSFNVDSEILLLSKEEDEDVEFIKNTKTEKIN